MEKIPATVMVRKMKEKYFIDFRKIISEESVWRYRRNPQMKFILENPMATSWIMHKIMNSTTNIP
jgi:hypothetical protein